MKLKCREIINWMCSKESSPYAYAIVAGVVLSLLIAAHINRYDQRCEGRFVQMNAALKHLRTTIRIFAEESGRYPDSLGELRWFCENVGGKDSWFNMYVDLTSQEQSEIPEYRQLNDKGGYYYDPNTGEVRLNLTRPVKEYLPRYRGRYKDQIPSSWGGE